MGKAIDVQAEDEIGPKEAAFIDPQKVFFVPVRGVSEISPTRIQRSRGWTVPGFDHREDREALLRHDAKRTQEEFSARRVATNGKSVDGSPGFGLPD